MEIVNTPSILYAVMMQEEKMQQLVLNWNSRTSQLLAPVVSGIYTQFHFFQVSLKVPVRCFVCGCYTHILHLFQPHYIGMILKV